MSQPPFNPGDRVLWRGARAAVVCTSPENPDDAIVQVVGYERMNTAPWRDLTRDTTPAFNDFVVAHPETFTPPNYMHVFSLGAQHNVCEKCGAEYAGTSYGCSRAAEEVTELQYKLIKAASDRGHEDALNSVFAMLEKRRQEAQKAGYERLATGLLEMSRDLPRRIR
jgi:hypothetical protein